MKIISWNVQGLKKAQISQEVKISTLSYKPDMIIFIRDYG